MTSIQNLTPNASTPLLHTRGHDCVMMSWSSGRAKGTNSTMRLRRRTWGLNVTKKQCGKRLLVDGSMLQKSSEGRSCSRTAWTIGASFLGAAPAAVRTQRVAMNLKELKESEDVLRNDSV